MLLYMLRRQLRLEHARPRLLQMSPVDGNQRRLSCMMQHWEHAPRMLWQAVASWNAC